MKVRIKTNPRAKTVHYSRVIDQETGELDWPLCGAYVQAPKFHPVIVTADVTCKRCQSLGN